MKIYIYIYTHTHTHTHTCATYCHRTKPFVSTAALKFHFVEFEKQSVL